MLTNVRTVGRYRTAIEAEMARGLLVEEGIPAELWDEEVGTTLNYIGPAVPVRVVVSAENVERAKEVLARGSFGPTAEEPGAGAEAAGAEEAGAGEPAALAPPGEVDAPEPPDETEAADAAVTRALRLAVVGLLLLPPVLNLLSLLRLVAIRPLSTLSPAGRRRWWAALLLNLGTVVAAAFFWPWLLTLPSEPVYRGPPD